MNDASSVFHLFLHVVLPTLTFDSLGKLFSIALFLKAILVFFSPKSRIVRSCLLPSLKPDFKAFCYSPILKAILVFLSPKMQITHRLPSICSCLLPSLTSLLPSQLLSVRFIWKRSVIYVTLQSKLIYIII